MRDDKHLGYREYFGGAIFREPRKGLSPRFGKAMLALAVLLGPAWILLGLLGERVNIGLVAIGVAFTVMYSAELLPKHSTKLAGYLRLAAFGAAFGIAFSGLVLTLLGPWAF